MIILNTFLLVYLVIYFFLYCFFKSSNHYGFWIPIDLMDLIIVFWCNRNFRATAIHSLPRRHIWFRILRQPVKAALPGTVTGAVLYFLELGVGSTLVCSARGSTLFNQDTFYPAPMNALLYSSLWKFNTSRKTRRERRRERKHLVSCWTLLRGNRVERFFSPSSHSSHPLHGTSVPLIRASACCKCALRISVSEIFSAG